MKTVYVVYETVMNDQHNAYGCQAITTILRVCESLSAAKRTLNSRIDEWGKQYLETKGENEYADWDEPIYISSLVREQSNGITNYVDICIAQQQIR